jgi:hypothetical protein
MPARLIRHGRTAQVRNLGWLLRNWTAVERFTVRRPDVRIRAVDGFVYRTPASAVPAGAEIIADDGLQPDAILTAHLRDGGEYSTSYASASMLWRFLHRPIFLSLSVDWYGTAMIIGAHADLSQSPTSRDPRPWWPLARQSAINAGVTYLAKLSPEDI